MAVKKSKKKSGSRLGQLGRTSKKMVDKVLVRISPQLQVKIDQLIQTLESGREGRVGDLSLLASKILLRVQDVSRHLRGKPKKRGRRK